MTLMASLDVESLFTNIPLQETIDLCVELLFNYKPNIDGFNITGFYELLTVTMSESLVLFEGEYYKQIDGVAMSSPLGPTFANIFLSYQEQIWYVDDTLLFPSKDHIEKFRCYLNCQHPNVTFTSEIEENNSILFPDINLIANILILSLHLR